MARSGEGGQPSLHSRLERVFFFFGLAQFHLLSPPPPFPPHHGRLREAGEDWGGHLRQGGARGAGQGPPAARARKRASNWKPPPPHSPGPHSPQVYKAREKSTGRLVALKKTRLEVREEGGRGERAKRNARAGGAGGALRARRRQPRRRAVDGGGPTAGRGNAGGPREEGGGGEGRAAPSQTKPTPETPARVPRWRRRASPPPPCARCPCCRCCLSPTTWSSETK